MADAKELQKLNRAQLNDLATSKGIEDAANEEKYVTKADLIEAVKGVVTPEEVEAIRTGEKVEGDKSSDEPAPTETPEEEAPTEPENTPADQPTPPPIDTEDDVDDKSGTEKAPTKKELEEEAADEPEETVYPTVAGAPPVDEPGMGFPVNKEGQTVDIFDGKTVHTHVRNVAGVMVPMSQKTYETKTDAQVIEKLKKMGKL